MRFEGFYSKKKTVILPKVQCCNFANLYLMLTSKYVSALAR